MQFILKFLKLLFTSLSFPYFISVYDLITWPRTFVHRAVVHLVFKLRSVVVHVNDEDVEIDGILHLVPVHIYCMSSQLKHRNKENLKNISTLYRQYSRATFSTVCVPCWLILLVIVLIIWCIDSNYFIELFHVAAFVTRFANTKHNFLIVYV